MKKIKLFIAAFAAMLTLTACHPMRAAASTPASTPVITSSDTSDDISEPEVSEPIEHKVYDVSDLVEYFNAAGEAEGISVSYIEDKGYWYLHYIGEESDDESEGNLSSAIVPFLSLLPLAGNAENGYLYRYMSKYVDETDIYFVYVAVSPNHFAACSAYGYIEDDHLIADVIIYDGRNGLYV